MLGEFRVLSLSYKNAPVELREKIAMSTDDMAVLLQRIKDFTDISDAMIVSTCNRTEVYYMSENDHKETIIKLISLTKCFSESAEIAPFFISINKTHEAVNYLFRVSMGLESHVVGDIQISNQVKNAYQLSVNNDLAGPFLHRLMHSIFFTNKKVSLETSFRDGAASVSYATVELMEELSQHFVQPKVLILGLGEMGADVCRNLCNSTIEEAYICNRTSEKAEQLAIECQLKTIPFEGIKDKILDFDIIISSLSVNTPFLTQEDFVSKDKFAVKYLIDMSVPRTISPELEKIPGIELYNIDMIQNKTAETIEKRKAAIPEVEKIIENTIVEFEDWKREMEVSPTIKKLKQTLEDIRQDEIKKHLKKLTDKESETIELITRNIMQKIIKLPVLQLKAACKRGEAETLIDVLNDLFNLEQVTEESSN